MTPSLILCRLVDISCRCRVGCEAWRRCRSSKRESVEVVRDVSFAADMVCVQRWDSEAPRAEWINGCCEGREALKEVSESLRVVDIEVSQP